MIPMFFTVTQWGGKATTRINALAITRLSPAHDGSMIYLAGGDAVRVNHSVDEVEGMIAALDRDAGFVTTAEVRAEINPRVTRRKAA